MASLRVSADLPDSYVQTRDLLLFAPALRGQPLFEIRMLYSK
jgi:hypothetical protein